MKFNICIFFLSGLLVGCSTSKNVILNEPKITVENPLATSPEPANQNDDQADKYLPPTAAFSGSQNCNHPYILIEEFGSRNLLTVRLDSGDIRLLLALRNQNIFVYKWATQGCQLIAGFPDGKISIIDLEGRIIEQLLDTSQLISNDNQSVGSVAFSYSNNKLAVTVNEKNSENETIRSSLYLVDLTDKQFHPFKIHDAVHVSPRDWTSSDDKLVFSSSNNDGITNIFVYDYLAKSKFEIESLKTSDYVYADIKWSPDGQKIAVGRFSKPLESERGGIRSYDSILIASGAELSSHTVHNDFFSITKIWWEDDSNLVMFGLLNFDQELPSIGDRALIWIDTDTNLQIKVIKGMDTIAGSISHPQPIRDNQLIGFFRLPSVTESGSQVSVFFLLNPNSHEVIKVPAFQGYIDVQSWMPAPFDLEEIYFSD